MPGAYFMFIQLIIMSSQIYIVMQLPLQNQEIIKALDIWEEGAAIHIPIIENHAISQRLEKTKAYTR